MTGTAATRERVAAFLDSDYAKVVGAVALATRDRERAEDAVQDALVKALTCDATIDNLSGWVTVVAINYVRQQWRRNAVQQRAYVRVVEYDDVEPDPSQRTVDVMSVREALSTLPEKQRVIAILHYLEGLTISDIAATLGLSEGTIKTQLWRAREKLGRYVGKEAVS